jgi:hypothetical protein
VSFESEFILSLYLGLSCEIHNHQFHGVIGADSFWIRYTFFFSKIPTSELPVSKLSIAYKGYVPFCTYFKIRMTASVV